MKVSRRIGAAFILASACSAGCKGSFLRASGILSGARDTGPTSAVLSAVLGADDGQLTSESGDLTAYPKSTFRFAWTPPPEAYFLTEQELGLLDGGPVYKVYRADTDIDDFDRLDEAIELGETEVTTFTAKPLLPSSTYYFNILATDGGLRVPVLYRSIKVVTKAAPPHLDGAKDTTIDDGDDTTDEELAADDDEPDDVADDESDTVVIADSVPPTIGGWYLDSQRTSIGLAWDAGSDDRTPTSGLRYLLCRGDTIEAVESIEACEAATLEVVWVTGVVAYELTGLPPSTGYWFNVIVMDGAGNKATQSPAYRATEDDVDLDSDGVMALQDPDDNDACNPNACPVDNDGDGVYSDVDPDDNDPCNPNACPVDNDGDGVNADVDPDDNDPCNPNACPVDNDGDGVLASVDPDDNDPCNPNACDFDMDGSEMGTDPDDNDRCNPTATACDLGQPGVIQVTNAAELQAMASCLTCTYALANDIDLSGETWTPVANFQGVFDGQSQTISNLGNVVGSTGVGLFGSLSGGAVVNNLKLADVSISYSMAVTTYAGGVAGSIERGATVRNSSVSGGSIAVTATASSFMTAGGGVAGVIQGAVVNSSAEVGITVTGVDMCLAGGLAGVLGVNGRIQDSFATGNVSSTCTTGNISAGGLVGSNSSPGVIVNSYSGGVPSTNHGNIGGLVGWTDGCNVTSSYWNTTTSGRATSACGAGRNDAQMQSQSTYVGWDFATTWYMVLGAYPVRAP